MPGAVDGNQGKHVFHRVILHMSHGGVCKPAYRIGVAVVIQDNGEQHREDFPVCFKKDKGDLKSPAIAADKPAYQRPRFWRPFGA